MLVLCKKLAVYRLNGHRIGRCCPIGMLVTEARVGVRFGAFSALSSTEQCNTDSKQSFTESYLMSDLGLSSKEALSISRKVKFRSEELPNSVTALLRSHGFTNTHIIKLVKSYPKLFNYSSNAVVAKLNFFSSLGVSSLKLPCLLSSNLMKMSLETRILPLHKFLKVELGLDDMKIAQTIKGSARATRKDSLKILATNIALLKQHGVPKFNWVNLFGNSLVVSAALLRKPDCFIEKVNEVLRMGFDPKKLSFCVALRNLSILSKPKRELKVRVYAKYGWSENMFRMAFKKCPLCMEISEKNIGRKMDFFVNKMGVNPEDLARDPLVLLFSMDKRVKPRCSVVKVLMLKGLLDKHFAISYVLKLNDKVFIDKFIAKYKEAVPELVDVFHGKIDVSEIFLDSSVSVGDE